jgi:hypothetical protein
MCTTSTECKTILIAVLTVKSGMDPHMISQDSGYFGGIVQLLGFLVGVGISWSNHPVGAGDSVGSCPVGAGYPLSCYPVGAGCSLLRCSVGARCSPSK